MLHADVGLDVRRDTTPDPTRPADGRKSAELAVLAVGVATPLIATAVAKVLDALGRNRKYLVTERKLVPAVDTTGTPVVDSAGRPILYWAEHARLIEAGAAGTEQTKASLKVPALLDFQFESTSERTDGRGKGA